jgi:hypothetical protein
MTDIHRRVAAQVFQVAEDDVTKDQRDFAKRLSFSALYSGGPLIKTPEWTPFVAATYEGSNADPDLLKVVHKEDDELWINSRYRGLAWH